MENIEKKEYTINDFRNEISEVAERELKEKNTADFGGFSVDASQLTEDDMAIWLKIKNKSVTQEDFEAYRKSYKETSGHMSAARFGFFSLAGNRANGIIGRRSMEDEMKKIKQRAAGERK